MSAESARCLLREASLELVRLRRIRGASHRTWRRMARAQARLAFAAALLAAAVPLAEPAAAADPLFRHGLVFDGTDIFFDLGKYPAFADIDGDGDEDVLVTDDTTKFFENTGTATSPAFAAPVTNAFGLRYSGGAASLDLADIDGDGDLDAFLGTWNGGVAFLANTGTAAAPAFAAPSTNPFGLASLGSRTRPALADLDGDGDLDLLAGSDSGDVLFFANTGTVNAPAFAAPQTNPFGLAAVEYNPGPALVDVDGDGDLDAFVGAREYTAFFANTGTATAPAFAAAETNPFGLNHSGYNPSSTFSDVDGDGDLDVLVGGYYANLILFENTGTANAPAFVGAGNPFGLDRLVTDPRDWEPYVSPVFGDLDGDGDLDALVGEARYGHLVHFENIGTSLAPAFGAPSTNPFGLASVGSNARAELADIDGDGDLDAFIGNQTGNTIFFANSGTATAPAFAAPSTNPFGLADVGTSASPALADADDDGDLDAFVGHSSVRTLFFANTGTATAPAFAAPSTNPFGLAQGKTTQPELVDVDADGDLDLFADGNAGHTNFFRNTGTASAPAFAAPQLDPFGFVDVGAIIEHAFADLDGDGDLDGFVGNYNGRIVLFENVLIDEDACSDGLDNDGDGRIDLGSDAGCANAADTSELSALQCDNGLDDDADGKIDWRANGTGDPHCSGLLDDRELPSPPPGPGCGIGPELLLLAPLLAVRRRRSAEG